MGLDFDVLEFCKKLRQDRPPPYQCPMEKCDKVYKSLCGLQYHLVNYDHDNPTPTTPAVGSHRKKFSRSRAPVPTADIALQSPPKEALTFAEAQKVVQFEIDGKISRIPVDQPLTIMSLEEWENKNATLEKPIQFTEPPPEPMVKLPEASYKLIPDYNERVSDAPPRPNAYIRYIEKSAEELDGDVEYDVDEEDTAWLTLINKARTKQNLPPVSVDTLELLMDRFEKESYFQATQNGQQPAAIVDEDAVCCICMDGECQNTNVILFCDMCNLAVHQDCYGVPYIPEGQWLCRRCLQSPSRLVNCVLCPNIGGAFKQTDQSTWAHVVCALWIPEVRFANTVFLEPIDSIEMIPAARWKLQCMVCKQRGAGACIQCHKNNCYAAFHVTCAQQAGLYMKMEAAGAGRDPSQAVQVAKMAYCDTHTPAHVLQERRAQDSEGDTKTDLSVIRQKGREKIKQARRVLAMKRTWAPVVLVPTLPAERVAEIARLAGGGPPNARAHLVKRLLAYWTLKRRSRNGVPLLRRLQSLTTHQGTRGIQDGTVNVRELCNQLKYWQRIRQDLERARLLCELVRKRERLKAEYTRVWERCLMHTLRPERAAMQKLLRMIYAKDTCDIFSEPVDPTEVPDYSLVVTRPMDLSTMTKKLERSAYCDIDDMEADFQLMIDNCLAYNNKDTVFYKAGVKMREQCAPIFKQARRDVQDGLPVLAGCGAADTRVERTARARTRDRSVARSVPHSEESNDTSELPRSTRGQSAARERRSRARTREPSVSRKPSPQQKARSVSPAKPATTGKVNMSWWRGPRGRGRGRRGRRGRGRGRSTTRPAVDNDDSQSRTSDSESAPAQNHSSERVNSPAMSAERPSTGLSTLTLKKPTLLVPSTASSSQKSFGSDASLPTLSASTGPSLEVTPKKKGRGRPKKDKPKKTDLFGMMGNEEKSPSTPVSASFLQYRGTTGEVGSDSDMSRSSRSSSIWSCSSCTHYDDDMSGDYTSSDGSSYNDTVDSQNASDADRRRRRHRTPEHSDREQPATPVKGRGTRSSSKTPVKSTHLDVQYEPLQLVWAKCRGYPWYPALIIDPKMPQGFIYNSVPLPVPPQDVLNLKKNHSHEPVLYLVLFFDVKRTWQWLPPAKLEPLGLDKSVDQAKMVESRKPTDKKAVKKAFSDAMLFQRQVDGEGNK